jgi:predicted kinase
VSRDRYSTRRGPSRREREPIEPAEPMLSPRPEPLMLALAGLPGTGKSTLAVALAAQLRWPVLDKDLVRAQLFGPDVDYSREQDDRAMAALYGEATAQLAAGAAGVILDGRTFTRRAAVQVLVEAAAHAKARLLVVECRCAPELARERLARDVAAGSHPARNRDPALHARLAAQAEPLQLAPPAVHVVVDTGAEPTGSQLAKLLGLLDPLRGR